MNIEASKPNFVVSTKKYGRLDSYLDMNIEDRINTRENYLEIPKIPSEVIGICEEIRSLGGQALMVGGSVRDYCLSQFHPEYKYRPKDFDIEVYGFNLNDLQKILEGFFGRRNVDTVGKSFGVIKVKIAGWDEPLDFSIPRVDNKTGQGHRGFTMTGVPNMSILEAARRRDITINSMAYDPLTKTLYDPFAGLKDLQNKVIRVTDTKTFIEDPLRVLRVAQFAARFGFSVDSGTISLCLQMVNDGEMTPVDTQNLEDIIEFYTGKGSLSNLEVGRDILIPTSESTEVISVIKTIRPEKKGLPQTRITEEFFKLLTKGSRPSLGFEFCYEIGLINQYWPMLSALKGIPQEYEWHKEGDVWTHTMEAIDAAAEISDREIAAGRLPTKQALLEIENQLEKFAHETFRRLYDETLLKLALQKDPTINERLHQIDVIATQAVESEKQMILQKMVDKVRRESPKKADLIIEKNLKDWTLKAEQRASGVRESARVRLYKELQNDLIKREVFTPGEITDIESQAQIETNLAVVEEKVKLFSNAKKNARAVIILATLCHDLGKLTTTKEENGLIVSYGHDVEGITPTRELLKLLHSTRFSPTLKRQILPLVAEHMRLNADYKAFAKTPNETQIMTRLARKLAFGDPDKYPDGGGTDLFTLSLVSESDSRGRKPGGLAYSREEMGHKLDWQSWIWHLSETLKFEQQTERLVDGKEIMQYLGLTPKDNGPWIGVIIRCLELDITDGRLSQNSADLAREAKHYFTNLNQLFGHANQVERRDQCLQLLRQDPREILLPIETIDIKC